MKLKEKTVPLNISVPLSLKQRMDKHSEINWSATACRAFMKQLQAQDALAALAEPDLSEADALERALKVQHKESAREATIQQLDAKIQLLTEKLFELQQRNAKLEKEVFQ